MRRLAKAPIDYAFLQELLDSAAGGGAEVEIRQADGTTIKMRPLPREDGLKDYERMLR